jgi:hypothetical protein
VKENPLTEIMGKFTVSKVYTDLRTAEDEEKYTADTEEGLKRVADLLNGGGNAADQVNIKTKEDVLTEAKVLLSGAEDDSLRQALATTAGNAKGVSLPGTDASVANLTRDQLIEKLVTDQAGRSSLNEYLKDAPKRAEERRKKWEDERKKIATNCGALPGWVFFQMGCNATTDSFVVDNPYVGQKDGNGGTLGKTMSFALSSYGLTSVMLLAQSWGAWVSATPIYGGNPYATPLPGDVFLLGIPQAGKLPIIKHVGIIVDPFFRAGYWLTADAGQGQAGINDGMKYIARKIGWGADGIRTENASTVGQGDEWPEILGWFNVDTVAKQVFDKKSGIKRKPISKLKVLKNPSETDKNKALAQQGG